MDTIPDMPDDFCPEIVVMGKDGNIELGYAITKEMAKYVNQSTEKNLHFLRWCIWQVKHDPTRYDMIAAPDSKLINTYTSLRPQGTN